MIVGPRVDSIVKGIYRTKQRANEEKERENKGKRSPLSHSAQLPTPHYRIWMRIQFLLTAIRGGSRDSTIS